MLELKYNCNGMRLLLNRMVSTSQLFRRQLQTTNKVVNKVYIDVTGNKCDVAIIFSNMKFQENPGQRASGHGVRERKCFFVYLLCFTSHYIETTRTIVPDIIQHRRQNTSMLKSFKHFGYFEIRGSSG